MFGGLAFMLNGHMCCGIVGDDFVVRTRLDNFQAALSRPHARPMDFTGRSMRGFVLCSASGMPSDSGLEILDSTGHTVRLIPAQEVNDVIGQGAQ